LFFKEEASHKKTPRWVTVKEAGNLLGKKSCEDPYLLKHHTCSWTLHEDKDVM
jgi:hypothetical protein